MTRDCGHSTGMTRDCGQHRDDQRLRNSTEMTRDCGTAQGYDQRLRQYRDDWLTFGEGGGGEVPEFDRYPLSDFRRCFFSSYYGLFLNPAPRAVFPPAL
ncbi:unnamed protein product [Staurois parvus]|uniref:Uncharacterized protein n=1 Tax=Staurois parvus TaxID=386267 RepID=A0ABN9CKV9_9NEOB|nr:unnamed protein product [Staurois parvus]